MLEEPFTRRDFPLHGTDKFIEFKLLVHATHSVPNTGIDSTKDKFFLRDIDVPHGRKDGIGDYRLFA